MKRFLQTVVIGFCVAGYAQAQDALVWVVVLASKAAQADAQTVLRTMQQKKVQGVQLLSMDTPAGMRYRVVVPSSSTRTQAEADRDRLATSTGIRDAWLLQLDASLLAPAAKRTKSNAVLDTTGFDELLHSWARAVSQLSIPDLRQMLHPTFGLFTKTSVGVLPLVQQTAAANYLADAQEWPANDVGAYRRRGLSYGKEQLHYGRIRAYDCDETSPSTKLVFSLYVIKEGSLSAAISQRLQTEGDALSPTQLASQQRALVLAQQLEGRACVAVHLGSLSTFEVLYFIRDNGRWYWVLQDNAEPCSA